MKTSRFIKFILLAALFIGLASCGTKTGEVSYANYEAIVTVAEATEDAPATTYSGVIILLGAPSTSTYDSATKQGLLTWVEGEAVVTVTIANDAVSASTSENLYRDIYHTPISAAEDIGIWQSIIRWIGYYTFYASNLFGLLDARYYWLGLLIMTLTIRTLGWPIYAKSNDMTLKMNMMQPEQAKIQDKYKGRTDQASQQRMQMEMMELYKKYKINFLGCLMPFLQMPIFIAMYQVVQRFPLTDTAVFNGGVTSQMNIQFLWTNLGSTDWLPNLPLALLVGVTMWLSQYLAQQRTKKTQKNVRYQNAQAQQTQKTMQFMMYFMTAMMAWIALGNAGIAFYWIIGNVYQLLQSYLGQRGTVARQDELRRRM
ncbi:MAG: YidC/Oxa1 family membrane protein insertase [Candidatus Izemoplasmatales bacterium]